MIRYQTFFARRAQVFWAYLSLAMVAALLVAACGGSNTATTSTPTAASQPTQAATPTTPPISTTTSNSTGATVKIVETNGRYSFQPSTLSIKAGSQVEWLNTSDAPHTVTSDTAGVFSTTVNLTQNQTFKFTFATAGTFPYHCKIHPYMKATITVTS